METPSNSEKSPDPQPNRPLLPSPKRGAIPSPKADIEKATPYRVETDPAKEDQA